ncbi:threonine ammonia-lyase IlvA [Lutimaribacter sp. EGI FJ00015]|uniref:Threonine ammonia-lyase IlvA n=1 Tax=Lutimaribacter degradans TaxID=2945989 RepID=A0ACC5ZV51_9RHOB|nr:threonine ammonia-lyase IlvA [Lutimaribacter sp. EGI FJ00013]MCM2561957.1 threonine ammonia-lyase IlvA [Lutimaribacter sp. EGI FJ00013]MCO0613011.1 threonine ammonia-lyase IlvA [Lutimaribacter sp. EGI FJ00015]MCO0635789.1 threonine ammonia-lyase IlvA [Lutimaribacter sp. EGI FJ00014]
MTSFQDMARVAERAMREVFPETPLQLNAHLSDRFDAEIWLKREDLTPVRSYKLRGAFNAMRKVLEGQPDQQLFVCASAGNHAQGVAYMCSHFGVKGVIFMPVTTPQQKIQKTEIFGGDAVEIRLTGDFFDDTLAEAQAFCADQGGHFLAPFDDDDVIEGQASVAVEIAVQMGGAPDHIILPVGGGGLSAGVRSFFGTRCAYTFVEPAGGRSLYAAVQAGKPVTLDRVDSFVDGASVARIGARPFERLRDVSATDVMAAPENRICGTMLDMLNVEGIVLEPAGALAVDALVDVADAIRGKRVVCVTSGGNFDFERLPEVKERSMNWQGLKKYFILRLPQRPGALRDFLDMLGPDDNITRFEYLKKNSRNFGSVLIGIETSQADNFPILFERVNARGFAFRDVTDDEILADFLI